MEPALLHTMEPACIPESGIQKPMDEILRSKDFRRKSGEIDSASRPLSSPARLEADTNSYRKEPFCILASNEAALMQKRTLRKNLYLSVSWSDQLHDAHLGCPRQSYESNQDIESYTEDDERRNHAVAASEKRTCILLQAEDINQVATSTPRFADSRISTTQHQNSSTRSIIPAAPRRDSGPTSPLSVARRCTISSTRSIDSVVWVRRWEHKAATAAAAAASERRANSRRKLWVRLLGCFGGDEDAAMARRPQETQQAGAA
jgi:hypothetical protein